MTKTSFETHYKSLNLAQKQAVDAIEGPVMVVAGPGTGKTQILTLRIASILRRTDTAPENILAITFTESGVYSMRKRLVEIIGSAAYKVNIYTFHGFCNNVIKNYPEEFPRIIGSSTITEIDQIQILEKIIDKMNLRRLKSFADPFYFIRSILTAIRSLKREGIGVSDFKVLLKREEKEFKKLPGKFHQKGKYKGEMKGSFKDIEKQIEKNKELLLVYEAYEKVLLKDRLYDYEDMIVEVVKTLSTDKNLLLSLQEKYHYILADEHQDANASQNKVLELISSFHDDPNLFIVGDEKQAIFRFQGASLDNFLYFKKLYPKAKLIVLEENYRSTQTVLDASGSLIEKNILRDIALRVSLISQKKHPEKLLKLHAFSKPEYEVRFVVEDIKRRLKEEENQTIAIIYRENKDAQAFIEEFEREKMQFRVDSEQNALTDEVIQKLIILLRSLNDLGNDGLLSKALFLDFLNISPIDAYKIISISNKKRVNLLSTITSTKILKEALVEDPEKISELARKLSFWSQAGKIKPITDFFEIIIRESGFLENLLKGEASADRLQKLDSLFTEARKLMESKREAKLSEFISYLDIIEEYNILIKTNGTFIGESSIRLMTAHRSKGLEFDVVYIVGVTDGHWGNKRERIHFHLPLGSSGEYEKNEDERRIFYVALTRAKKEVLLTYSTENSNGDFELPSQFIEEIDKSHIEIVPTVSYEERFSKRLRPYQTPRREAGNSVADREFLRELFLEQGLNVTALNNYLECPWRYFFVNLLRIPERPDKHQLYGIAIHEALRNFFDKRREGLVSTKKDLLIYFLRSLREQSLTEEEFLECKVRGEKALSGYFETYNKSWIYQTFSEVSIAGVFIDIEEKKGEKTPILLKGKLDKIDFLNDFGDIRVVDYKTGKPKSRNEIEGKTKSSNGNYKRQLVFYKLLVDRYFKDKYKFVSALIDYIEADDRGKYHKEEFLVSNEEVLELEETIKKVATEFLSFSFWDKKCKDKKCQHCALGRILKTAP